MTEVRKCADIEQSADQRLARFLRGLLPTIPIKQLRDSSQDLSIFDFDFAGLDNGSFEGNGIDF